MERIFAAIAMPFGWFLFAGLVLLCWWLTVMMALDFSSAVLSSTSPIPWHDASFTLLFLMWAMMMLAMMLPSFVPTVSCYRRLLLQLPAHTAALRLTIFAGSYFALWLLFSVVAALLQQYAAAADALAPRLFFDSPLVRAIVLLAAGGFQWSPLKMKCLQGCRHPMFFFMLHWSGGNAGAARMGGRNGLLCVGCCWLLMLLLFVGGVMELTWIVGLTFYVLVEKTLPLPPLLLARASGSVLIVAGGYQFFI
ncbi:MAG: DUF2182 domain-containing protein [Proteobacteria bacterium]|nr:DUF2182 domain-containing protein [Pseudomonadota bacterium]